MLGRSLRSAAFQIKSVRFSQGQYGQRSLYSTSQSLLQMMSDPPSLPPKNVKDRHRRRPPVVEEPDYFSDSRSSSSSSSGSSTRTSSSSSSSGTSSGGRGSSKFAPEQKQSTDPWKILVKKLDTTKGAKEKFGKVIIKKVDDTVDELQCIHFDTCAGCSMKGNFSDAPIVKRARSFFASENLKFPTTLGNHTAWRTHVKLAVRPLSRWGGLKIGLFRAGSHEVEAIPDCKVHHPRINEAVEELRRAAMEVGVKGYQEAANGIPAQGELRYIQMSVERETQRVQVVLVWNVFTFKEAEQTLPRLVKRLKGKPDLWHSVYVNFQTSASNVILNYNPKAWKLLWGPPALKEKVGNANFFFAPQIFRQVRLLLLNFSE